MITRRKTLALFGGAAMSMATGEAAVRARRFDRHHRAPDRQQLETVTGQPFVIENKPGATGMIGTTQVKNAPADGHTILLGSSSTMAANPSLYKQMTYDPADFTTVAVNGTTGNFMLVNKDAPDKTVKEFAAYAKSRKSRCSRVTATPPRRFRRRCSRRSAA